MLVFMACLMFCALSLFNHIYFTYRPYEVKCAIQIFLQVVFQRYIVSARIKLLNAAYLTYVPTLHVLSRFHSHLFSKNLQSKCWIELSLIQLKLTKMTQRSTNTTNMS